MTRILIALPIFMIFFVLPSCSTTDDPRVARAEAEHLSAEVQATIRRAKTRDRGLHRWFEESAGYAVFPTVSKGGLVVGGAHGEGQLFRQGGEHLGKTVLSQGTFGLQVGGQTYSEFIFFKDEEALRDFMNGNFEFSGQTSAVLIDAGASADAAYQDGVLVFTAPKSGAMLEASIGGQQFEFYPRR